MRCVVLVLALVAGCGSSEHRPAHDEQRASRAVPTGLPDCTKVTLRVPGGPTIEVPDKASHCIYVPHTRACCREHGANCDAVDEAIFISIERDPRCPTR